MTDLVIDVSIYILCFILGYLIRWQISLSNERGNSMKNLIHNIRIKLGLYDLRKEGAKWVAKNIGEEYVEEFLTKYDDINRGIPIGGMVETIVFLDMIEQIKREI